ncbi:trypsin-like peptidase domain-containing protein [Haliangium sp. UPWRP_2]|uniref:trypsin-like peptidase domain-containing protein n=1 Tax=Haliangium sp. UPWRP_2 TaxID=1931276 RepID=UPI000B546BB1|nr:trypsin-like peptidase domain-containing protein [Haliangium sp. UPWRP_2]PSM32235.1 PDZ domain-containing protein [Haliangium sp. UPWRP_2]
MQAAATTSRCAACLLVLVLVLVLVLLSGATPSRAAGDRATAGAAYKATSRPGLYLGAVASAGPGPGAGAGPLFPLEKTRSRRPMPSGPLQLQAFANQASHLGPAVVSIISWHFAEEEGQRRRSREQGTGVIVNPKGYILTNNHVVEHSTELRVRLQDERELSAQLIGRDERTDIALLKIDAGPAPLQWAALGDSDQVRIGEWVMAIGNPFGLDHSVTLGIVSAKGRREVQPGNGQGFFDFLQTDASINPGNSGGPLFSTRGEVIGINTAINVVGSGIGFAIPSNIARAVAEQLYQRGRVLRSWLGVYPQAVSEPLRRSYQLPDRKGALLAEIYDGSPAARAGLQIGDVIVEFDGKPIQRADDLMWQLGLNNRRSVPVRLYRGGRLLALQVQFPEPDSPPDEPPRPRPQPSALGIVVSELTSGLAQRLGLEERHGLIVMAVEPGSPAMDASVERGDIILRVGDRRVHSLEEYVLAMREIAQGEIIRLLIRREERNQWHNLLVAFRRR